MREANLALRFVLELGALAAVGYWGLETGDGALGWLLAAAAVAVVAVVWGLFVAPKARIDVARPVRFAIEVVVWVSAGVALAAAGHAVLGLAFAAVSIASGALNWLSR